MIIFLSLSIIIIIGNNPKNEKWVLEGNKVSKGNETYEIGDYYDYDESNGSKITNFTDVKWKVLGISDEGNLLIFAASNVETLLLGSNDDLEISKNDYILAGKKLNEIAKKYANSKNALSGRSITLDDINKITKISDKYLNSHKASYTFYWTNEIKPVSVNDETNEEKNIKLAYDKEFLGLNENNKWIISKKQAKKQMIIESK